MMMDAFRNIPNIAIIRPGTNRSYFGLLQWLRLSDGADADIVKKLIEKRPVWSNQTLKTEDLQGPFGQDY